MKAGGGRIKGHAFERQIAIDLRSFYPEARRGLQARDGAECPDVIGVPFWVECKAHRRVNIQKAMNEARADAEQAKSDLPVLVVSKDDRKPTLVTLEWDSFRVLLVRLEAAVVRVTSEEGLERELKKGLLCTF